MPGFLHQPRSRREFLRWTALGGAAWAVSGCQTQLQRADATPVFRVALLSDTHIPGDRQNGHRGFNPYENLRSFVPHLVQSRPDAVVLCGDAARLEGKLEDYQQLRSLLEPVAEVAPIHIGLGNHDHRENFFNVFPAPAASQSKVEGRHVTVIEHPSIRLLVLDSLLYVNQVAGLLGRNQREWLRQYLPHAADRPMALFVHHTLDDGDGDLLDAPALFELVRPHRHVKAVFYGHSHVWALGRRDHIQLINLPASGYNFRDHDPVGWVDARFGPHGADLTLRAPLGSRIDDGRRFDIVWAR